MHMADALTSPVVAGAAVIVSGTLFVIAAKKVRNSPQENIVPLMGVMGAFIFAAQMINFSIPGTGSSGHIVGGVLLSAILGPWAGFITLTSVLVIQCLIFADGGLMALGCNIFNMAACTCLIAYPLLFKPLMKHSASMGRIIGVSILTCVVGLELGAIAVTLETEASGITALPIAQFLWFMLPIHLVIGIGEGLATAAVLYFVQRYKPELLLQEQKSGTVSAPVEFRKGDTCLCHIGALLRNFFQLDGLFRPRRARMVYRQRHRQPGTHGEFHFHGVCNHPWHPEINRADARLRYFVCRNHRRHTGSNRYVRHHQLITL